MTVPAVVREDVSGAASTGPIDLAHLARQTFGSHDLEREVLDLFAVQARDLVARIAATSSVEARGLLLHRLKGSARGVGAVRIAALAEALEAPGTSAAEARDLVAALVAAEAEARRFVEDRLRADEAA